MSLFEPATPKYVYQIYKSCDTTTSSTIYNAWDHELFSLCFLLFSFMYLSFSHFPLFFLNQISQLLCLDSLEKEEANISIIVFKLGNENYFKRLKDLKRLG